MEEKGSIKKILIVIVFIIVAIVTLYLIKSKNYAKTDEISDLKDKITQEIYFLDDYIISIANRVNNINLENYTIKSEILIGSSNEKNNNSNSSGGGESGGQAGGEQSGGGQSSGGNQSENGASGDSSSGSSSQETEKSGKFSSAYNMKPTDILVNSRTANWESIKIAVERLYSIWPSITVDLYKLSINTTTVQSFSRDLDELTKSVKAEDKNSALNNISKLYNYLTTFGGEAFKTNLDKNMINTKANIVNAYALIEQQKWDEIQAYLKKAEDEYMNIMNNNNNKNQYNVNKAYILLKEFQTSIGTSDTDIMYIRYKNLLDELNVISI